MTTIKAGDEADPLRNPAVALLSECPFCRAAPGEPCRTLATGSALELPHYSRTSVEEN